IVRKAVLWRKEIDNRPGMLANALQPLSEAGADLQVVMAYRYPGASDTDRYRARSGVWQEVHSCGQDSRSRPATNRCLAGARGQSAGLGHTLAKAIGDAGSI